uniref:nucleoside deaminase n=1 Tax=Vaginimicrobium propionicum TaxID=1871034 RepID=UPI000970D341|nr:nucleoside deaminase [Vaginimicrobium propionicum]
MALALGEARAALAHYDVPVGAIVLNPDGVELARAHNRREELGRVSAHAEILAIEAACQRLGQGWRLDGCTMVVTLEPCPMCAGAIVQSRLARLVFGAFDDKAGAVSSLWDLVRDPRLNHRMSVIAGVEAEESSALLKAFFVNRR